MGVLLVSYVHLGYVTHYLTHYLGREQNVIYCYNDLKVVWALSCSKKKYLYTSLVSSVRIGDSID